MLLVFGPLELVIQMWASWTHLPIFLPFIFHVFVFFDVFSGRFFVLPISLNFYLSYF